MRIGYARVNDDPVESKMAADVLNPNALISRAEMFTEIDPGMTMTQMLTYLYIARRGMATQRDIEVELGLSNASASRNVSYWTDMKVWGKPGQGFIERYEDPQDRRYKVVRLTKKGREFYDRLTGRNQDAREA
jgi:DNA-binding MarR family transcriptional regulator